MNENVSPLPNRDQQVQAETLERIDQETRETAQYPPSFVDRFMRFVERLPGPYWLTYLLFFVLESGLTQVVAWSVGIAPAFTFQPILLIFSIWLWFHWRP